MSIYELKCVSFYALNGCEGFINSPRDIIHQLIEKCGERGIRTLGALLGAQHLSRMPLSATQPSLRKSTKYTQYLDVVKEDSPIYCHFRLKRKFVPDFVLPERSRVHNPKQRVSVFRIQCNPV
jgi:hypothetical protein